MKKIGLLLALLLVGVVGITGCGSRPAASQCIIVVSSGFSDAHHVKRIIYPGERSNTNGDTTYAVPCNARNYLVRPDSQDRQTPITIRTKNNSDGTPGAQLNVFVDVYWALNQNEQVLANFLPFCLKYSCASSEDQVSGNANYATPGWNGMLHENFDPALDRAGRAIGGTFDANLPNSQGDWSKFGDTLSAEFSKQLEIGDGGQPFFCGQSVTRESCPQMRITVDNVQYANPDVERLYQQSTALDAAKQLAQKQAAVNRAQLDAARAKYGSYAPFFLGLLDAINACDAKASQCVFNVGGGSVAIPRP